MISWWRMSTRYSCRSFATDAAVGGLSLRFFARRGIGCVMRRSSRTSSLITLSRLVLSSKFSILPLPPTSLPATSSVSSSSPVAGEFERRPRARPPLPPPRPPYPPRVPLPWPPEPGPQFSAPCRPRPFARLRAPRTPYRARDCTRRLHPASSIRVGRGRLPGGSSFGVVQYQVAQGIPLDSVELLQRR